MIARRRPTLQVFAVEDTTVQLMWRHLAPGSLRLTVEGTEIIARVPTTDLPGTVVLDGLPPGRALRIRADLPGPKQDPVLLAATTPPSLPGAELSRLATIGDLHLGTRVFGHNGTIRESPEPETTHPERCARAALRDIQDWGADHLVVKGDVTNHGQVAEWRMFRSLLDDTLLPVDSLPGNHDRAASTSRPGLSPEVAAQAFALSIAAPVLVRDLDGVRLVLVDSTSGGRHLGRIRTHEAEVLEAVAETTSDRCVIVALHHQLQPHLLSEGWPIGVPHRESKEFLERLARVNPRVLVTSGHTHRHRRWDHAGVVTTQIGSTKDYPGVWAGYVIHEGGIRQVVRRISRPDCLRWTDQTRRAAFGAWRWVAPGPLSARCFDVTW